MIVNFCSDSEAAERRPWPSIHEAGGQGETVRFDVADQEETEKTLEALLTRHETIDILINNAGVAADGLFRVLMSLRSGTRVINISLNGFYNVTRPILKNMVTRSMAIFDDLFRLWPNSVTVARPTIRPAKAGLKGPGPPWP